ncbi:MAG: ATP-binding cassette domain-containing protein [Spirochaetes bacterium]|nr:ATP-binding cassette domain-containing protein [Spirochaetota bacterium]MBU1082096.1 ATP-binding cassette domain-containing protein [Spirochaetota bacterium]
MAAIVADRLSKTFSTRVRPAGRLSALRSFLRPENRDVEAVKGVSFEVGEGEVVAFLGPNGAGKSTTIKMLMGILRPSGGSASVLGLDPVRDRLELSRCVGAVFGQKSQLWFHLPPSDSFRLLGAIYEIDDDDRKWREAELIERFGLAPFWDVPVRKLSLGERIRCEIAASLLPAPLVLFLDEPTIGLDVVAKREIRQLLADAARIDDTTVFMTSHDMGDIEKVCKRAIIIHHGEVVVDETMKDLRHRALSKKYVGVRYASPVNLDLPSLSPVKRTAVAASYEVDTREHSLAEVVRALAAKGELEDITVEDEPLENVIAGIYSARTGAEAQAFGTGLPGAGRAAPEALGA